MKVELKTWAGLGLATALAGAGLAGCAGEAGEGGEGGEAVQVGEAGEGEGAGESGGGEAGEGEGGEGGEGTGGEGGEGGVNVGSAATDPVVYGSALAVAEAHVIAARDAYRAGQGEAAGEMFAHPVSEVLLEMDPVFAELGVEDFKPLFSTASAAALGGADVAVVDGHADAIIAALRSAADMAPDNGSAAGAVAGGVIADQIERAVAQYAQASEGEEYGPYLDGYGYYKAAESAFAASSDAISAENSDLHERIGQALELLGEAYPSAERPASLDANQGALSGASSRVMLTAG